MHAHKRFRSAGHTNAPAQSGTVRHVTLDVFLSSVGATPADALAAIPAAPPAPPGPDPVVVANPVAGTGATAYPADLRPISSLSMLLSQPPFAWKLDLPGRKRAREVFMATWEVEVETQDGGREPALKMSFPCAIRFPNPRGVRIPARGGHWGMDCCLQGRAEVPEEQLRWLAAFALTGSRG